MIILIGDKAFSLTENEKAKSFLQVARSDIEDITFLENNQVHEHNDLYRLDYSVRQLSPTTLDYISAGITTQNLHVEEPQVKTSHPEKETHFALPPINEYTPNDFQMKSLCTEKLH